MSYNNMPDRELLHACIYGEAGARDHFVERFSRPIYNSIYFTLRRYGAEERYKEEMPDLFQDTIVSVFKDNCKKLSQYRGDNQCSAENWLRIIASSITINFITRNKTFNSLDDEQDNSPRQKDSLTDGAPSALDRISDAEKKHILNTFIEQLNNEDKLILKYHLSGLSSREIGRIVSKSQNAIDSKISRTRKKLVDLAHEK